MNKIVSKSYKLDDYDHLDGKPLLNGDMVLATFPDGHQVRTHIVLKSHGVYSSPSCGDRYDYEACIAIPFHGVSIHLSLRDNEIQVKRD